MSNLSIDDVAIDDVPAAMAFAQQAIDEGWWDGDWAEVLLNRQTNTAPLQAALSKLRPRK